MANPLVLTFAEIAFVLQADPDRATTVRECLRIKPEASSDITAAAGLASLLARGLCTVSTTAMAPTDPIVAVTAGLSTSHTHTEAVSWTGDRPVVMHLFSSRAVRLALFPAMFGQFTVEPMDAAEPLVDPLMRFFDRCATGAEAAMAVRSATGQREVSIAVARDLSGTWYLSDSVVSPDRAAPSTRDGSIRRLAELLGMPDDAPWPSARQPAGTQR